MGSFRAIARSCSTGVIVFHEEEKKIFRYEVQGEVRFADPLAVWRSILRESRGEFERWRTDAAAEDPPAVVIPAQTPDAPAEEAQAQMHRVAIALAHRASTVMSRLDAEERVLACIRTAFALPPFDPQTGCGVPESDCWLVLAAFEGWLEKNGSSTGS